MDMGDKKQLKLGDIVFDSRRVIFLSSLQTVVCSGLSEALEFARSRRGFHKNFHNLRSAIERFDCVLTDYEPQSVILLGPFLRPEIFLTIARRWGKNTKLHIVASNVLPEIRALAEKYGCEIHNELIWDKYRFVETEFTQNPQMPLITISGHPHYVIHVGKGYFGGFDLSVFLKGLGHLMLPSFHVAAATNTIFRDSLERYDVFAVGHSRVFPLGKVADIKIYRSTAGALPITKTALAGKLKSVRKKAVFIPKI